MKSFAEYLRRRMSERNESYATLAAATGLDATTISDISRNDRDVRISTFVALCVALKDKPSDVLQELLS